MGATRWQTFRYLRFPAALPVIFSGIKTSATIAATAAIVAEFVGANKGLGYVLLRGTSTMDIELVFAVLVVLTIIGIAINYVVEFCEWAMTPWQRAKNMSLTATSSDRPESGTIKGGSHMHQSFTSKSLVAGSCRGGHRASRRSAAAQTRRSRSS